MGRGPREPKRAIRIQFESQTPGKGGRASYRVRKVQQDGW